jgi:hypothetical protein
MVSLPGPWSNLGVVLMAVGDGHAARIRYPGGVPGRAGLTLLFEGGADFFCAGAVGASGVCSFLAVRLV